MKLEDFSYKLPKELIADKPAKPRDQSRLLILHKESGRIEHKKFFEIIDYLQAGDVLVMNNSKVFPARLLGKKDVSQGKMEVFLLNRFKKQNLENKNETWRCLLGGRGAKENLKIIFSKNLQGIVKKNLEDNIWLIEFNQNKNDLMATIKKIGQTPLPPYIKRAKNKSGDKNDYQTVYASEQKIGSVAAPTAGLHFSKRLLKKIKDKGVQIEYITLHVGLGTFLPIKTNNIKDHKMHSEEVEIKKAVAKRIVKAKQEGRRIVAVGTTSLRSLEGCLTNDIKKPLDEIKDYHLAINLFIYPGYEFKVVDNLITNFHLPKSSLLLLVSALASSKKDLSGLKIIKKAYQQAVDKKYRFFSFGDAMLIKH